MSFDSKIVEIINPALLEQDSIPISIQEEHLAQASKISSQFFFDYSSFAPTNELMDFDKFINVCSRVIKDAQAREGVILKEQVELIEDYPAERFDRFGEEVVAWKLISRKPGQMARDASGRPQRTFTYHYDINSPADPNKNLEIEARPLDHIIEFQCWSKSAKLANRRAIWLERLFVNHAWAFLVEGTDRFYFMERLADWYTSPGGQNLYVRPIRFFVRTYEFRIKGESIIRDMSFVASYSS